MLLVTLLILTCQRVDPPKRVVYVEEPVVVRVLHREGGPGAGVAVEVRTPSGVVELVGRANDAGEVQFVPHEPGAFEIRAKFADGPLVVAIYHVARRPRRFLWAAILIPLGLLLAWRNLRQWNAPPP